jgi:uncharacterized protein YidB (DUF937 family)
MPRITATTDHTLKASSPARPTAPVANAPASPLLVSVSESAKLGGVQSKTIRRAIAGNLITYHIHGNRYLIDLGSLLTFLRSRTKLHNKLNKAGLGQYVDSWVE